MILRNSFPDSRVPDCWATGRSLWAVIMTLYETSEGEPVIQTSLTLKLLETVSYYQICKGKLLNEFMFNIKHFSRYRLRIKRTGYSSLVILTFLTSKSKYLSLRFEVWILKKKTPFWYSIAFDVREKLSLYMWHSFLKDLFIFNIFVWIYVYQCMPGSHWGQKRLFLWN